MKTWIWSLRGQLYTKSGVVQAETAEKALASLAEYREQQGTTSDLASFVEVDPTEGPVSVTGWIPVEYWG